jgi:CubicO group peptidase (beta-lactamase class C family)
MITSRLRPMPLLLGCTFLAAAFSGCNQSGGGVEQKVDQVFAAYDKPDSPGCALGVIKNGDFIYKRGYGTASLELGVPMTPQSVVYMGSVSKQFTAATVVLAAEQGFLSLDDDVRKYLPELPNYGKTITIRQMLHHTSGFRDILGLLPLAGRNVEDIHPTNELLDLLVHQKALNYVPGDEYVYSNTNYFLMSVVIHRATGKPMSQFAEENIFKPLGMTHTHFYEDRSLVVPGRIPAYQPRQGGGFSIDWSTNFDKIGDGGLLSSVDDLLFWDRDFYDNKLGKGTLLNEMQTQGVLNNGQKIEYALGLMISHYRGLPTVEHGGALFGYRTELIRFPQQKFSVVCLCNLATSNPDALAHQVADIYLEGQLAPAPASSASSVKADPHPFAGSYRDTTNHTVVQLNATDSDLLFYGMHFKPTDATHFSNGNMQMAFDRRPDGVTRLTLTSQTGAPEVLETFQAPKLSADDLKQYAGEYASSEVETTYHLTVADGKLTLAVGWFPPATLEPTVRDEFQGPGGSVIVFQRSGGRPSGFGVFAGRVRNVSFTRTSK